MTFKPTTPAAPRSKPSWTPRPYQLRAVKFLVQRQAAALLLDPGMGKTSCTLAACLALKKAGVFRGALILAPMRVADEVWPEEVAEWEDFKDLTVQRLNASDRPDVLKRPVDLYVTNFEALPHLLKHEVLSALVRRKLVDTLVVDELSKFKHTNIQRFKLLKPWLPRFTRRWGLTGSPFANGILNIFGQIYTLDLGASLGPYVTYFRAQYFNATGSTQVTQKLPSGAERKFTVGTGWELKPGADEQIYARLANVALRLNADDYLKLPKVLERTHSFTLPDAARRVYDKMEEELVVEIERDIFTAANTGTALGKCRQIASGALYHHAIDPITGEPTGRARTWRELHDTKLDAFMDLIEELQGQPVLVGYEFGHDKERLIAKLEKLGAPVHYIGGGASKTAVREAKDLWNAGRLPYLLCHPQSAAHGLNLQKGNAQHVAFFTPFWDYELYDQFIRRLRRSGNAAKHIHVHNFIARNTVEEYVHSVSKRKERVQNLGLAALEAFAKSRKSAL